MIPKKNEKHFSWTFFATGGGGPWSCPGREEGNQKLVTKRTIQNPCFFKKNCAFWPFGRVLSVEDPRNALDHSNDRSRPTSFQVARACAGTLDNCVSDVSISPEREGQGPCTLAPCGKSDFCVQRADWTSDDSRSHSEQEWSCRDRALLISLGRTGVSGACSHQTLQRSVLFFFCANYRRGPPLSLGVVFLFSFISGSLCTLGVGVSSSLLLPL